MKMIKLYTLSAAVITLSTTAILSSCSDERDVFSGEGLLSLTTSVASDVKVRARAAAEDELSEKAIVWISNSTGAIRKYNGLANVPAEGIPLLSGHYIAEVWTGDSVSASFDQKYYKGREEFDITKGNTTRVDIRCGIANAVASVVYQDNIDELIHDYKMTVGHKRGDLVFEGRDDRKGYFMMPSSDKDLKWNLEGTLANGTVYTRSGVIENARPGTEYIIRVGYTAWDDDDAEGAGFFTIEIDERTIDIEDELYITLAPQFSGFKFNIDDPIVGEPGQFPRKSVIVAAVGNLTSVIIESDALEGIVGGNDVDLLGMTESVASKLQGYLTYTYSYDEETESSAMKVNFEENFFMLMKEGESFITLSATDTYGKTSIKELKVIASKAPVATEAVNNLDVWATHATVSGRILSESATNPGISYRKYGTQGWTPATDVSVDGGIITANLTGLVGGTTYEYIATADDFESTSIKTFTTETTDQLPNASFENWQASKAPYLIYGDGDSKFWDSGNHGSATMSKNVTTPATEKVHSGQYSVKLTSQFVGVAGIGKFAAGNLFIGEYLATLGTNGVLGWGRPWTSRPTAVKGYIHYTPQTVNYSSTNKINKGDMDQGIIYVAILDNNKTDYEGNSNYPVIVNTKTEEFFDGNPETNPHLIAYGELVLTESTSGDAMVEFTIPLTYFRQAKACHILLTAAASRYGDYFSGGPSVMYLDDIELVY